MAKKKRAYKADISKRVGAGLVDGLIGAIPGIFFMFAGIPFVGALLLLAYLLLRDGMGIPPLKGQSVGKRLVGLHVEIEKTGKERLDPVTSIKRNAVLASGVGVMALLTLVGFGFIGLLLAGIPAIVELVKVVQDPNGLRIGDTMAGTKVYD